MTPRDGRGEGRVRICARGRGGKLGGEGPRGSTSEGREDTLRILREGAGGNAKLLGSESEQLALAGS